MEVGLLRRRRSPPVVKAGASSRRLPRTVFSMCVQQEPRGGVPCQAPHPAMGEHRFCCSPLEPLCVPWEGRAVPWGSPAARSELGGQQHQQVPRGDMAVHPQKVPELSLAQGDWRQCHRAEPWVFTQMCHTSLRDRLAPHRRPSLTTTRTRGHQHCCDACGGH